MRSRPRGAEVARLGATIETDHFRVTGSRVTPRFGRQRLDNDLTDLIVAELGPLGLVPDAAAFERLFVATVEAVPPTPALAWDAFYRNTMLRLASDDAGPDTGSVAAFRRIYARALSLVAGDTVLDLGCCFGFFPVLVAEHLDAAVHVLATDVAPGTVALAARSAAARRANVRFAVADAERLPLADRSIDTVTAIHLLEHLPADRGARVLAEAVRVARRRVLLAVPLEPVPEPAFGHVRAFTLDDLEALAERHGWSRRVWEADGGWLQLDAPPGFAPAGLAR